MSAPRISIIIPAYNSGKYIEDINIFLDDLGVPLLGARKNVAKK